MACTIVMRWKRRFKSCFLRAKFFFETRPGTVHVLCEHFRGSTNQHAIPNRRTSAKENEILLMWCTTIWQGSLPDILNVYGRNAQLYTCFTGSMQQLGDMLRPVHSREGDFAA